MGIRRMPRPAAADDGAPGEHPHSRAPALQAQPRPACHPRPDGPLRPHGEITLLQASTACSAHLRSRYCPRGSAPAPHPRPVPSARQCKRKSYGSQQLSQSSPSRKASARESSRVVIAEAVVATEAATSNSEQIPCPPLSTKWPRLAAW